MKVIQINRLFIYYYSFNVFDSKSEKVFDVYLKLFICSSARVSKYVKEVPKDFWRRDKRISFPTGEDSPGIPSIDGIII